MSFVLIFSLPGMHSLGLMLFLLFGLLLALSLPLLPFGLDDPEGLSHILPSILLAILDKIVWTLPILISSLNCLIFSFGLLFCCLILLLRLCCLLLLLLRIRKYIDSIIVNFFFLCLASLFLFLLFFFFILSDCVLLLLLGQLCLRTLSHFPFLHFLLRVGSLPFFFFFLHAGFDLIYFL